MSKISDVVKKGGKGDDDNDTPAPSILSRDQFGLNAHIPSDDALVLIQEAGFKWVRLDFNWHQLEPRKGSFNYDIIEQPVSKALSLGLSVYGTLAYAPEWAGGGERHKDLPNDVNDWVRFVSESVSRYRDRISHWGLWNEPNGDNYANMTAEEYRDVILIPGAEAVRNANPEAQVLGPDLITFGDWQDWIRTVFSGGVSDLLDVFTCHIYKDKSGADGVVELFDNGERIAEETNKTGWKPSTSIRYTLNSAGFSETMAIWLTEVGWKTKPPSGDGAVSQREQAAWCLDVCESMGKSDRSDWWKKTFIYEAFDDPSHQESQKTEGIMDGNLQPKESYRRLKEFLHDLLN